MVNESMEWIGKFIELDGVNIHYLEKGEGFPLLLVHGLGSYSFTWRHNLDELARFFRVYALDLKGFGLSDKPRGKGYSIDHHVKTVLRFMSQKSLGQVHYAGSSMGGEIGLRICIDEPEKVNKLVLIGSSGFRDKLPYPIKILSRLPYQWFVRPLIKRRYLAEDSLVQMVKSAFYHPNAISDEEIRQYLYPFSTKGFEQSWIAMLREFDFGKRKAEYQRIRHPVLIIAGEHDRVIPHEQSVRLHQELKHASFVTIPECGHFLHEEKPTEINDLMIKFLLE